MDAQMKGILEPEIEKYVEDVPEKKVEKKVSKKQKVNKKDAADFYGAGLDQMFFFRGKYDSVVFVVKANPSYPLATACARARDALKEGGHLIIDFDEISYDEEHVVSQISFLNLELVENKDGVMVFQK